MPELNLSQHFSIEDIHKIREYNYEMTKNMTTEERIAYYNNNAEIAENRIQEFKKTLTIIESTQFIK